MKDKYNEIDAAQPTSRVLDGSSDHGYDEEYVGYGEIDGKKVKAIYLIDYEEHGSSQDTDKWDWDIALKRFEFVD